MANRNLGNVFILGGRPMCNWSLNFEEPLREEREWPASCIISGRGSDGRESGPPALTSAVRDTFAFTISRTVAFKFPAQAHSTQSASKFNLMRKSFIFKEFKKESQVHPSHGRRPIEMSSVQGSSGHLFPKLKPNS